MVFGWPRGTPSLRKSTLTGTIPPSDNVLVEFADMDGVAYAISPMPVRLLTLLKAKVVTSKPTLAEALMSMPEVGYDSDFARVEEGKDARLAAEQMKELMANAPPSIDADIKKLINEGRK